MSLGGVSCHIDIYDNDWPSGSVTEISQNNVSTPGWAADDPFYYEEDDSEDLLDVIRTKSGYIRLIENNYGDLNELFPQTNMDRYVRVLYGDTLVFTGYIKAESYGLNWGDYHREISLPVISPLSLADGIWFTPPSVPEHKTLSWWMYDVINRLDSNIWWIEFPDPNTQTTPCIMSMYLCSLVLCPQDVSWNSSMSTAEAFYSGKSFKYFLEGFCNAYGLIVHDEPERLVFSRFDYTGLYSYKLKSTFRNSPTVRVSMQGSDDIEALDVNISNKDNEEYTVLPLSKITVECDGEFFSSAELPTEVCRRNTNGGTYNMKFYGCYNPLNAVLSAGDDNFPLLYGPYISVNGRLSQKGVEIAYDGSDRVLMQKEAGGTGLPTLIYFRLYNMNKNLSSLLKFNAAYGDTIESLNRPGVVPTLRVFIKNGDMYYAPGSGWSTTEGYSSMSFNDNQQLAIPVPPYLNEPLEIYMKSDIQYWSENYIYVIDNIEVSGGTSTLGDWYIGRQEAKKVINGNPSEAEGTVSMAFSRQWKNSNYLSTGYAGDGVLVSEPSEPLYPYLTTSQKRLQIYAKGTLPTDHYLKKITFSGDTWRIIAKAFHPWNDEWKLTLHSSSIFTSNN